MEKKAFAANDRPPSLTCVLIEKDHQALVVSARQKRPSLVSLINSRVQPLLLMVVVRMMAFFEENEWLSLKD